MASKSGFVSVPVVPTFKGMSKSFTDRLINPARKAGQEAGAAISGGLEGSVKNLERQVRASEAKLGDLDRDREKKHRRQQLRETQDREAKELVIRAEEKYAKAVQEGSKTADSAYKQLSSAKVKAHKAANDLADAQADAAAAEKKHKDQLDDLSKTTERYAQAQSDLSADLDESAESVSGLGDRFTGLKDNMVQGLDKITTGAFLGIGAKIGTSIMSGVQDVMSQGWETALDIDKVSRSLAAMTSEGEVAEQMMGDLRAVAGEMPVDYTAFLNAANTLAYMGYEGDAAVKVLENVATAATGAGNDGTEALESAANALGKMQANGKVTQDEIATISSQGVPMLDMLIEHFGMTEGSYEELKNKISEGGVELDDVFAALGDTGSDTFQMLAASAENMNQSLDSQMKMLKDDIFVGIGEALQPVLNDLDFQSIADSIGEIAARMMEFLPYLIELGLWVADNIHWIAPAAGVLIGIAGAIKLINLAMLANPIVAIAAGIVAGITAVVAALTWFFTQTEVGQELWEKFTGVIADGWDWVTDKIGAGVEWLQEKFGEITDFVTGVTDILFRGDFTGLPFGLEEDSGLVDWLFTARENVIEVKDDVVNAWGEVTAAFTGGDDGYGALASIFGEEKAEDIINIIADIGERFTEFKDNVVDAFEQIQEFAAPIFDFLKEFFTEQMSETFESLGNALGEVAGAFMDIGREVGGALWDALSSIFGLFKQLWDLLSPLLLPVLKIIGGIVGGLLVGAFMLFVGAIRVAAEIIEVLAGIISWVMQNILGPLIRIIGEVASAFVDILAAVVSWFGDLFGSIFDGIRKVWDGFTDLLFIGFEFVTTTVFGGIGAGLETLRDNFDTAVEAIKKIWDGIKEAAAAPVRFMVNTVWNEGIIRAIDAVAGVIGMDGPAPIALGFARGGILPGYSRMVDGDDQLVPMRKGEGVLVSEALQDEQSRRMFLDANAAGKRGKSFAEYMSDYVHGYASGGIVGSLNSIMSTFYPELQMTSHFRPGDSGYHGKNMAADFSNTGAGMPSTPAMQAAAAFMFGNYGDQLEQLIHHPARNIGSGMDVGDGFGYYGAGTMYEHTDHIHLAALKPLVDPSGVVQMVPYDGESGGGWFNPLAWAKKVWDTVINAITPYPDEGEGWFSQMPGNFLRSAAESVWEWVTGKIGAGSYDGTGGISGDLESWREMAMAAMRRNGFNADDPAQVDAMMAQIWSESSAIPDRNQEIVDMNGTGAGAGQGLLQIIPGTFADHRDPSLPNDRTDPWANMNAALRYYKWRYGDDLTTMWGHGHGYAHGGIVDMPELFTRDMGGWVPHGALVRNTSGGDELMLPPKVAAAMTAFFEDHPEAAKALQTAAEHIESAAQYLESAADYHSEDGITARQTTRRILGMGLDLPGTDVILAVLDGEEELWAARERQLGHLDNLAEKEQAITDARKALAELESSEEGLSKDDQRKLDDAEKAVADAKADEAKADSDEKRAKAADKVADAEEKLLRVREDLGEKSEEAAQKRAEDITKANDDVMKAEEEYAAARQQQVKDLDHLTVISQRDFRNWAAQATSIAGQLKGMGVPAAAVSQGLAQVTGALGSAAAMVGPAGVSLGMALDVLSVGIKIVDTIVKKIEDLINFLNDVRMAAQQALADGMAILAEYAELLTDMQQNVSALQQEIVRGMIEQRTAELNLRIAQQGRLVAQAEGILAVHEARLALDEEIRKGAVAAQIRLMGLHEDWDSYLSFQAWASQGVLDKWSDAAISALFTYEQARAQALQAELSARIEQINAEAALAEATRQNVRNQQDLLTAQERIIRMAGKVAGIDLVDATATSQVANLLVQMAEIQQKMDSNIAGRIGAAIGTGGPWSNEYRGQQAAMASMRTALDAILAETGVSLSNSQINKAMDQMKWVSATDGDPLAVLRQIMPELAAAETALKIDEVMKPIDDARDAQRDAEREAEDFRSEIDLYEKLAPLEELIAGLDYTIAGLGHASDAWAEGNEALRAEYLAAWKANREAAAELGVNWQLDEGYATSPVREQIAREVTIHMNGSEMYTADQVDELIAAVTAGSNVRVRVEKSASDVALSRRGGMA